MTKPSFFNWFKNVFLKHIDLNGPNVLIFDGHLSHVSIELILLARANNVTLFKLPPHTSHILQPLDVCVFYPFKVLWDKFLTQWAREHIGQRISKRELSNLVGKTYRAMDWKRLLVSGFKHTGLFDMEHPQRVNKNAIPESKFDLEKLERYKNRMASEQTQAVQSPTTDERASGSTIPTAAVQPETTLHAISQTASPDTPPPATQPGSSNSNPTETITSQSTANVNEQVNGGGSLAFNEISAEILEQLPPDGYALVPVRVLKQTSSSRIRCLSNNFQRNRTTRCH